MQNDPKRQNKLKQAALARFYGLVAAVAVAVFIAFAAIVNLPGLQDPETGRFPEAASLAVLILFVGLIISFALVIALNERRSR